jgi:hypothetical protein
MSSEGLDFVVALRDNRSCEGIDYGGTDFRRRSLIAAMVDRKTT